MYGSRRILGIHITMYPLYNYLVLTKFDLSIAMDCLAKLDTLRFRVLATIALANFYQVVFFEVTHLKLLGIKYCILNYKLYLLLMN